MIRFHVLVSLLALSFLILSCQKEEDAIPVPGDPSNAKCLLTSIQDFRDGKVEEKMTFSFNNLYLVTSLTDSLANGDWFFKFSYDSLGRINQSRKYLGEESLYPQFKSEIEYLGDTVAIIRYKWYETNSPVGEYYRGEKNYLNRDGEVIRMEELKYNDGEWVEGNDYYILTWKKGNLIRIENYDNYSQISSLNLNKKTIIEFLQPACFYFPSEHSVQLKSITREYHLAGTTYFEYDSGNNPYRPLSNISGVSGFNVSKNNPLKARVVYSNQEEETTDYAYVYNEYDYPVQIKVFNNNEQSTMDLEYNIREDI